MRVDKDGAMSAGTTSHDALVDRDSEVEAEIVELTPHDDATDRSPELQPVPKEAVDGETVLVIPYTISAGEPALLVPMQEDFIFYHFIVWIYFFCIFHYVRHACATTCFN